MRTRLPGECGSSSSSGSGGSGGGRELNLPAPLAHFSLGVEGRGGSGDAALRCLCVGERWRTAASRAVGHNGFGHC